MSKDFNALATNTNIMSLSRIPRNVLALIMLLVSVSVSAQGSGVAGVKWLDTYDAVQATLDKRFGKGRTLSREEISYFDVSIGGIPYGMAEFYFTYLPSLADYVLTGAQFYTLYDPQDSKRAVKRREYYKSVYSEKYDLDSEFVNEDGYKVYAMGTHPYNEGYVAIMIGVKKCKNGLGESKLSSYVLYPFIRLASALDDI